MPKEREVRYVLKRLAKEGWVEARVRGSHHLLCKDGKTIPVPTSRRELPIGTYRSIAKNAGWLL